MPQLEDGNEKVTSSVIPNGTEAKVMRNLIENKGLLNGKGKLYAGTADTTSTGAPVTTAIDPSGADDDSVLIKDSSQAGGWKVDKVGKDNIKDAAITPEKLQATGDFNAHSFSSKDDNIKYHADYRADRIIFNSTAKDSDGQVTLVPSIAVGQTVMLGLPSEDGTLVTAEEIESGEIVAKIAKTAKVLQGWWRHFVNVSLTAGSGTAGALFNVYFELFTSSGGRITNMTQLIAAIQKVGSPVLATGVGYVGTGANIPDVYTKDNIADNRAYVVSQVVYDEHLSTKACCMMIAKTTLNDLASDVNGNIVAMDDTFSEVYIGDTVWPLFS